MPGQIHRIKKERDYVQLDTNALRNSTLSWKAKGLHSYLMQLPDDWRLNIADLQKRSTDGRDSTAAGLKELLEAGYVVREIAFDENGFFAGYDYNIFEQPDQAVVWKSVNGKSVNGKSVNGKSVNGKSVNGKSVTNNNEEYQLLNIVNDEGSKAGASDPLHPYPQIESLNPEIFTVVEPFTPTGENISLEAEKPQPTSPGRGAAIRVSITDPDLPGVKIEDIIPEPKTKPVSTGREPKTRKSTTQEQIDFAQSVLDEINLLKGGRPFKINEGENAKGIIARHKEGATFEEMKIVIADKWREWGGSQEWQRNFNPVTLFRNSNFSRYLVAAIDRQTIPNQPKTPNPNASNRSTINGYGGNPDVYAEKQIF